MTKSDLSAEAQSSPKWGSVPNFSSQARNGEASPIFPNFSIFPMQSVECRKQNERQTDSRRDPSAALGMTRRGGEQRTGGPQGGPKATGTSRQWHPATAKPQAARKASRGPPEAGKIRAHPRALKVRAPLRVAAKHGAGARAPLRVAAKRGPLALLLHSMFRIPRSAFRVAVTPASRR